MKNIVLDVHDFTVLIEASWHCGTILRYSIMERAINEWYAALSPPELARVYEFFNRTQKPKEEIQHKFLARYNPNNQFFVTTLYEGKKETHHAYKFNDEYFVSSTKRISKEYITEVEPDLPAHGVPAHKEQEKKIAATSKVIDGYLLRALRKEFDNSSHTADIKFQTNNNGVICIDCKITPPLSESIFDAVKKAQREIVGAENISEFYTEEEGHHWQIFLKGC